MSANGAIGSVATIWRFPVKSMGGEQLEKTDVSAGGLPGDRAFALIETETGRVASAKSVRRFPDLLQCRAAYVDEPQPGRDLPAVRITLPDGRSVRSDARDADRTLSAHFRRDVRLARAAPEDFTIDQYHPDIGTVAPQKLGSAYFRQIGAPSAVPEGSFFDLFPVSVLTTSTLARLTELQPESRFDLRRFRMNVIVATTETGFPENGWIARVLTLGDSVRLRVAKPDLRCVMTTLPQDDVPSDPAILRALVRHNPVRVEGGGTFPCAGVYTLVEVSGSVRSGDRVALSSAG